MSPSGVTVIVPVRDRAELLATTLRSVTAQRPRPQILVADDGSTDGSADVARAFGAAVLGNDGPRWGAAGARNAALEKVGTDLVAYVDSDDILCPGALERLSVALDAAPEAPFAFGCALVASDEGGEWQATGLIAPLRRELRDPLPALFARNFVPASGALTRTEAARAAGGHDRGLGFSEDHDFWLRLARRGRPAHVPEIVSVYRSHTGNRHGAARARADDATITGMAAADPRLVATRQERLGTQLCEQTVAAVKAGAAGELAASWRSLVMAEPDRLRVVRHAGAHFRRRRRAAAVGARVWAERPDLRAWLAEVSAPGGQPPRTQRS